MEALVVPVRDWPFRSRGACRDRGAATISVERTGEGDDGAAGLDQV